MILIQLVLEGIPGTELRNENINPMLDARGIFAAAVRVAKCASVSSGAGGWDLS